MGLVLGPIHHWTHKKIRISEAREKAIVEAFKEEFGKEAGDTLSEVYKRYPPMPPQDENKSLEELLEGKSVHAGIQGLMDSTETRGAAIIAAFYKKFGEKAKEVAARAAFQHGLHCAQAVVKEKGLQSQDTTPAKAFELLLDNFCDGMPCDRGAQVLDENERHIVWDHSICIHGRYWDTTGAPPKATCDIIISWIAGFGKGVNSSITHRRQKCIAYGDDVCVSSYEMS